MEYSHHILILLAGFTVAALALFGVIAVGPYGRRGIRPAFALVSLAALCGSVLYLIYYYGLIQERRAFEARAAELRAQALAPGSPLACLQRIGRAVEDACAQTLFASPETLANANLFTASQFDLLIATIHYRGPRPRSFNEMTISLQTWLQQDPFGLTANLLMQREGCTAEKCGIIAVMFDPSRVWENIRQKTFEANVARYAAGWRAPAAAAPAAGLMAPTGGETRAPIPDKYTLPSSSSIPPVSIMNDEPLRPAPPPAVAKDRPASPPPSPPAAAEPPPASAPAALPRAKQPAKQQRRETQRSNAPLSIAPKR